MFQTLFITFREGLEAFLMVAVATLYLRKTDRHALISAVRSGLAVALLVSIAVGVLLAQIGASSPLGEGMLALIAAAAVIWCVLHMRKMGKHMSGEISSGIGKTLILDGANAWWAVFAFVFFMVSREGMESAAMLSSLAANSELRHSLVGGLIGLSAAAALALLWTKFGRQVNLSRFFNVTAVFMLVFAVMLVLKSFYEFTEVNLVPGIDNQFWHQASAPYVQGSYAQVASMLLVLAPTLWLIAAHWIDTKRGSAVIGSAA